MDYKFLLRWTFFTASIIKGSGAVFFLSSPSSSHVEEGDSLTLFCHVDAPLSSCDWFKKNTSGDPFIISTSDERYRLFVNLTEGTCNLVVVNASHESDSGQWQCRLMTSSNLAVLSEEAHLEILPRKSMAAPSSKVKPGVLIGSFCAATFFIGGLVTIYFYKRKQPCFLAPSGHPSRSMLIVSTGSPTDQPHCYDSESAVNLMSAEDGSQDNRPDTKHIP